MVVFGIEEQGRGHGADSKQGEECRKDAARTAFVKIAKGEATFFDFSLNHGSDQKARDNKKHIHPDVTARKSWKSGVEKHHWYNRQCAQSIYILAVLASTRRNNF